MVRYRLYSTNIVDEFYSPAFKGGFVYKKAEDNVYHTLELSDDIIFRNKSEYDKLIVLEAIECEEVTLEIQKFCDGNWSIFWTGVFSYFDMEIDRQSCNIIIKPEAAGPYKCIEDRKDLETNLFTQTGAVIDVQGFDGNYEVITCSQVDPVGLPITNCITASDWCEKESYTEVVDGEEIGRTVWHRIVETFPCTFVTGTLYVLPNPGPEWTLLEDNCDDPQHTATFWKCPTTTIPLDQKNGRALGEVLQHILDGFQCGLTLKSDFLNVNPDGSAPANAPYAFSTNYHNVTVHQKSDVKFPLNSNTSTAESWYVKQLEFIKDVMKILNLRYVVDNANNFVLEHYSYFTKGGGLDLSNIKLRRVFKTRDVRKTETFRWMDELATPEFVGSPIVNDCGKGNLDIKVTYISTDISFIGTAANHDDISSQGFCLIANTVDTGTYTIIDNNSPFSWEVLHEELHTDGRSYKSGEINGVAQAFDSWEPYTLQDGGVGFRIACNEDFDPADLVTTVDGFGTVLSAEYNIYTCFLIPDLAY